MADQWRPAVASSPVAFTDAEGAFHAIPIGALRFGIDDRLDASGWPLYAAFKAQADVRLAQLTGRGQLRPAPGAKPKPALLVTARTRNAHATVSVETANPAADAEHPENGVVDMAVTEEDRWTGLTVATLATTLGEAADAGSAPGLVFAVGPFAGPPKAGTYPLTAANATQPAEATVPTKSGGGDAFVLRARGADDGGDLFTARITAGTGDAFDLLVTWKRAVTGKTVAELDDLFAFAVEIAAPPGGARLPAAGTTVLSGGADAIVTPGRAATATLVL